MSVEYLFIDGAYLRERVRRVSRVLFGVDIDVDLLNVKHSFGASKTFYYDCLDDLPRPDESEVELRDRIRSQQDYFDSIQSLVAFHVRLGTLTGGKPKRLRQKEVDVQLAVDMMWHSFQGNIDRATLLAGDLDFRPVVNSLILMGKHVRVAAATKAASKDLFWAADEFYPISTELIHAWYPLDFRNAHFLPETVGGAATPSIGWKELGAADFNGTPIQIYDRGDGYFETGTIPGRARRYTHSSATCLRGYIELIQKD